MRTYRTVQGNEAHDFIKVRIFAVPEGLKANLHSSGPIREGAEFASLPSGEMDVIDALDIATRLGMANNQDVLIVLQDGVLWDSAWGDLRDIG